MRNLYSYSLAFQFHHHFLEDGDGDHDTSPIRSTLGYHFFLFRFGDESSFIRVRTHFGSRTSSKNNEGCYKRQAFVDKCRHNGTSSRGESSYGAIGPFTESFMRSQYSSYASLSSSSPSSLSSSCTGSVVTKHPPVQVVHYFCLSLLRRQHSPLRFPLRFSLQRLWSLPWQRPGILQPA